MSVLVLPFGLSLNLTQILNNIVLRYNPNMQSYRLPFSHRNFTVMRDLYIFPNTSKHTKTHMRNELTTVLVLVLTSSTDPASFVPRQLIHPPPH